MIKLIALGLLFIVTSGSLFNEKFRQNRVFSIAASVIALISAYYLFLSINKDFHQIINREESIKNNEELLSEFPPKEKNKKTNFPYKILFKNGAIDFVYPKQSVDQLFKISAYGDLAGALFAVEINDHLNIACQHDIPMTYQSDPITTINAMLEKLHCRIDGSKIKSAYEYASIDYHNDKMSIIITVKNNSLVQEIIEQANGTYIFKIGFPTGFEILEQTVNAMDLKQ